MAFIEGDPQSTPIEVNGEFGRTLASQSALPPENAAKIILEIPLDTQPDASTQVADLGAVEVFSSAGVDQIQMDLPPVIDPDLGHSKENHMDAAQEGRIQIPMQARREVSFGSRLRPHAQLTMGLIDDLAPAVFRPRPTSWENVKFRTRSGRWNFRQRISRTSGR